MMVWLKGGFSVNYFNNYRCYFHRDVCHYNTVRVCSDGVYCVCITMHCTILVGISSNAIMPCTCMGELGYRFGPTAGSLANQCVTVSVGKFDRLLHLVITHFKDSGIPFKLYSDVCFLIFRSCDLNFWAIFFSTIFSCSCRIGALNYFNNQV